LPRQVPAASRLNFALADMNSAKLIVVAYVLYLAFAPLLRKRASAAAAQHVAIGQKRSLPPKAF
jgi:hypothetical protein